MTRSRRQRVWLAIVASSALAAVGSGQLRAVAPAIAFTKSFGGSGFDDPQAIAVDGAGNIYVTGSTTSTDLPVSSNAFQNQVASAFVAKLNPQGSLIWLTYLGGVSRRYPLVSSHSGPIQAGQAIAVDAGGNVYVAGYTAAKDFPTRHALQPSPVNMYQDAFLAKLSPTGSDLIYSTYLGGTGSGADAAAIAVTAVGEAVVGINTRAQLPFETRDLSSRPAAGSIVVLKVNPAGGRVFATRFGGSANDVLSGLAVDGTGAVHLAGAADSVDFPTTVDALTPRCRLFSYSCQAGFAAKLDPSGTRFLYSTYIGTPGGLTRAGPIAPTANGSTVAGTTSAPDFTLLGVSRPPSQGSTDVFALTLNRTGRLMSSTILGGAGHERVTGLVATPAAGVALVGVTDSGDYPLQQPLIPRHPDGPLFTSADAARSWTASGQMLGGNVRVLAIAESGPSVVYVGTDTGLFRSTDNGGWESIFDSVPPDDRRFITAVAIDPRQPTTIYAGNFAGVFKTINGGARWVKIDASSMYTPAMAVDGNGTVFLGDKGIRKSRDGGLTWTDSSAGLPLLVTQQLGAIDQIAFDPNRPGVIYALYSGTIYKATDGGDHWTRVEIPNPSPGFGVLTVRTIAIPPGQPGRVYAGGYFGIFRSDDDGVTWKQKLPQVLGLALAVNAQRPNTVYAVTSSTAGAPIMVSQDAGETWSAAAAGVTAAGAGVHLLVADPRNGDRLLAAAYMRTLPFVTVLGPGASGLIFSTLLGDGTPAGLASDVVGDLYVLLSQNSHVTITKITLTGR